MHPATRHGVTPPAQPPQPPPLPALSRPPSVPPRDRLLDGSTAAGLGLAGITVVVLLLWITSPYPDGGPGGALHTAAGLWLMAHGAPLIRTETLGGAPAPVGLVPLLLCALPLWLLHRTVRGAVSGGADGERPWRAAGWTCAGYLLVAAVVTGYAASGPIRVDPLGAALRVLPVTAAAAAAGCWTGLGRPVVLPARVRRARARAPEVVRPALTRAGASAALRCAAAATAVLCAGGALLTAGALLWHVATGQRSAFPPLASAWSGYAAVLLLSLALVPNAAVWGASWCLGPGFTLGGGSTVTPAAVSGLPRLPDFPLLAALPAEGRGTLLTWTLASAVPLAAGLVTAWGAACAAVPERDRCVLGRWPTACVAWLAACGCGTAMALLAAWAGGPLGTGALAHVGPGPLPTGAAALGWTAGLGVPGALVLRAWRLRPSPRP
ncbi:DUF6350 family protein [Streptomyces glaucosporus]|uniref:DUF6350 family protein n=1 Tax=Streptomyces glaucosporus TaxID=284044 RepID=A0ABP5VXW1_9ACTN